VIRIVGLSDCQRAIQADYKYLVTANFNWQVQYKVLVFSQPNKFGDYEFVFTVCLNWQPSNHQTIKPSKLI